MSYNIEQLEALIERHCTYYSFSLEWVDGVPIVENQRFSDDLVFSLSCLYEKIYDVALSRLLIQLLNDGILADAKQYEQMVGFNSARQLNLVNIWFDDTEMKYIELGRQQ